MRSTIETYLTVDGSRFADTRATLDAGNPTALDGLTFTWGRDNAVDQPDTGTCTVTIRQTTPPPAGAADMYDAIHVGSGLQVWCKATYDIPNQPLIPTLTPGDTPDSGWWWRTDPAGPAPTQLDCQVYTWQGMQAAVLEDLADPSWAADVGWPIQPFDDGNNPGAWDGQPRLVPGQTWDIDATVFLPAGVTVRLAAYAFQTPYRTDPNVQICPVTDEQGQPVVLPSTHTWQTVTGHVILPDGYPADGAWIVPGLQILTMPDVTTWDQQSDTWDDIWGTWDDRGRLGVTDLVVTPHGQTVRDVLAWSGQVVDTSTAAADADAIQMTVDAVDDAAPLANETLSDQPWPRQDLATRANRIMTLASTDTYRLIIDQALQPTQVAYQDVDALEALGMLQDLATSAGGVLWIATHALEGTYLWMEDFDQRATAKILVIGADGTVTIGGNTRDTVLLSACDLLRDPVTLVQDVTQTVTSVDVGWQQEIPPAQAGDQTTTEGHTATVTDTAAAAVYGLRKLQVDTQLTTDTDAQDLAGRLLHQARISDRRLDGLTHDTRLLDRPIDTVDDITRLDTIMALLDGTQRLGIAVNLTDLPQWIPADQHAATVYIEGGTYTLDKQHWTLELTASPAGAVGRSVTWDELPTSITWDDLDPTIAWDDLYGVAAPA